MTHRASCAAIGVGAHRVIKELKIYILPEHEPCSRNHFPPPTQADYQAILDFRQIPTFQNARLPDQSILRRYQRRDFTLISTTLSQKRKLMGCRDQPPPHRQKLT
jgi:hypothetical protein